MSRKSIDVKIRPLANTGLESTSLNGAARLYINKDSLIALTGSLETGKLCTIEKLGADGEVDGVEPIKREALLWVLTKNVSPNVVMMSRPFQDASRFKIGDQARISLSDTPAPDASEVVIKDTTESPQEEALTPRYDAAWPLAASSLLSRAENVFPGMILDRVTLGCLRRSFQVVSVNNQNHNVARFKSDDSAVRILRPGEEEARLNGQNSGAGSERGCLILRNVPGFSAQVKAINEFLEGFTRPFVVSAELASCGLVIHGGRGTGKTFILRRLADTNWGKVHWIMPSHKLATIKEIFTQAQTQQPCMILIDDLQNLITEDRTNRTAIIETLSAELDALSATANSQNALPRVVIVATCSDYMTDVPLPLQKLSRFGENVTLPIPRFSERVEILRYHSPALPAEATESYLADIAQRTHAYNASDLATLVQKARRIRGKKIIREFPDGVSELQDHLISREDMEEARIATRPTAMHDINLQPPIVHWKDIGGQDDVKRVLSRIIKHTKDSNSSSQRLSIRPPKGVLLYGPPGCSKTLSAQAMATESSFNFFAVKGAELLNMYVGESERAVRDLFERARAAAPSIIFFDEIDTIGSMRPSGSSASSKGSSSIHTVAALLTEMDGFESLSGVVVMASTNKPEILDPALVRAGRFDKMVYVPPPDQKAREAIFRTTLGTWPLAADVDIPALAALSDGHSGSEVNNVCHVAAEAAFDRHYDDESGATRLELTMADLVSALDKQPKVITRQMLYDYEQWARKSLGK